MTFTTTILHKGTRYDLTWTDTSPSPGRDGVVTGDPFAVALLNIHAEALEHTPVGPPDGPHTITSHLKSGISTYTIINTYFEIVKLKGTVPSREGGDDLKVSPAA